MFLTYVRRFRFVPFAGRAIRCLRVYGSAAREVRSEVRGRHLRQDFLIALQVESALGSHDRGLFRSRTYFTKDASGLVALTTRRFGSFILRFLKRNTYRIAFISSKSGLRVVLGHRVRI